MYQRPIRSDELYHYGVKGMRWGVRRYQNYDGTLKHPKGGKQLSQKTKTTTEEPKQTEEKHTGLTDKQKKAILVGAGIAAGVLAVSGGVYLYKKYGVNGSDVFKYKEMPHKTHISTIKVGADIDVEKLSKARETISKDTVLQRISNTEKDTKESIDKGRRIYASFTETDNKTYINEMPDMINKWRRRNIVPGKEGDPTYISKMSLKRDIKLASDYDVATAYKEVFGKDKVSDTGYKNFFSNLSNNAEGQKLIDALKSKGFDGCIDPNDADSGWTEKPTILFNPKDVIKNIDTKKMEKVEKWMPIIRKPKWNI